MTEPTNGGMLHLVEAPNEEHPPFEPGPTWTRAFLFTISFLVYLVGTSPGAYWIEDKPENAKLGADLGLKTIMLRHKHNATFDDARIKVVDNWAQVVNYIN